MLGATGAVMMDLGFTPEATWAILAVTRSFAAGAHYIEEVEREGTSRLGQQLTPKEDYDGPEDRPVPPIADRAAHAKPALCKTPEEWKQRIDGMKNVRAAASALSRKFTTRARSRASRRSGSCSRQRTEPQGSESQRA
jgi:hypothetical protein